MPLVNGQTICIRCDFSSLDVVWTEDKIDAHFAETITHGRCMSTDDYWSICDALADHLNSRTALIRADVLDHITISYRVLAALELGQYTRARHLVKALVDRLLAYYPQAEQVWQGWCVGVLEAIKSGGDAGFDGITIILPK